MKLLLTVPPIAITNTPLLAVPTLSAYLKSKDIEVVTFDANLAFYYSLLTEEKILNGRLYAKERHSELKSKKNLTGNEKKRLFYYQDLLKTPESILNEEIIFNRDKKTNVNGNDMTKGFRIRVNSNEEKLSTLFSLKLIKKIDKLAVKR